MQWPPEYSIKISQRAKYLSLKISSEQGLVCVVPKRYNQQLIPSFIDEKRHWIEKHLSNLTINKALKSELALPDKIVLPAINQSWLVSYIPLSSKAKLIDIASQQLTIFGKIDDKLRCQRLLVNWLKLKAEKIFRQQLTILCKELNLSYDQLLIRGQKTRWGSCSADKKISLNYKLLFLPQELMQHVLIHELCHTKYLNHSKRFWQLVAKYDTQFHEHNRQLKQADHLIPRWLG